MLKNENINEILRKILAKEDFDFKDTALALFEYQYKHNTIYRQYTDALKKNKVKTIEDIPFLPIHFFKTHRVGTCKKYQTCFESSGTTHAIPSKHYIYDLEVYKKSLTQGFENRFGALSDYLIIALLPSYLNKKNSSLVYMANEWMKKSFDGRQNFYLHDFDALHQKISKLEAAGQSYILLGVTYALLQFSALYRQRLKHGIVIETGGMKGMEKEITRHELYTVLKDRFETNNIASEYGMTELLSQAYTPFGGHYFSPPSSMKVLVRDVYNPFAFMPNGQSGGLNIIDLINAYSCPFIETADLGKVDSEGNFEVLGRIDNSELRGCNLMYF